MGEPADWQHGQTTTVDANAPIEHRFLLRLRDHPSDLSMRMVFADWLEEIGQTKKAEIVRLLAEAPTERSEPAERLHALSDAVSDEWLAIVSRTPIEKCNSPFKFRCPKSWESLTSTDDATIRHCGTCDQQVFFCASLDEVRARAADRHCVAFSSAFLRQQGLDAYDDGDVISSRPDEPAMLMGEVDPNAEWDDLPTDVR